MAKPAPTLLDDIFTEDEKRADELLDKAIELSKQANQILANLPSAVCMGRKRQERERLIRKAAELRELAHGYYETVDAIEDELEEKQKAKR